MFKYDRCDTCLYGYGGECQDCEMLSIESVEYINGNTPLRHCKCLSVDVNERCPYYKKKGRKELQMPSNEQCYSCERFAGCSTCHSCDMYSKAHLKAAQHVHRPLTHCRCLTIERNEPCSYYRKKGTTDADN